MADLLCGVCKTDPKKYKCPSCALPYCSFPCFKIHKAANTHATPETSTSVELSLPQPLLPAPIPRYLKKRTDFSVLATSPKFQDLLKNYPALFTSLQHVYAKTIEPDPEAEVRWHRPDRQAFRGRGSRGRGRRWNHRDDTVRRWNPKKGDSDAMGLLKRIRDGKGGENEKETMAEFVRLVEEIVGEEKKKTEHG